MNELDDSIFLDNKGNLTSYACFLLVLSGNYFVNLVFNFVVKLVERKTNL